MSVGELERRKVSVLVPVSPPVRDLVALHRETVGQIEKLGVDYEFLYLVGWAGQEVLDQIRCLHEEDPQRVRVLRFAHSLGEAAMMTGGFERARGEILFTLPPRAEVDLSVLPALYRAIEEEADLAFASRALSQLGASPRLQSRIFNRLVSWAVGGRFSDVASSTRAMRREVVEQIPLYGEYHRYLPVLARRLGFSVREVPAAQHPRASTPLLYSPRLYLWRALDVLSILFLSRFTRRPLRLFGGVGALFGAAGAAILGVLGIERLLGTPLAGRPLLVLGMLLLGLGVQAFTIGLLGELILFFQARSIRDYRIAEVYEAASPPLPEESPASRDEPPG